MWVEREETIHGEMNDISAYVKRLKEKYGENFINMSVINSCYSGIETEAKVTYSFLVNTGAFVRKRLNTNNVIISLCDIKKVIFNSPATIVFWEDGTKTVVKVNGEDYDPEKGLAMAIAKKSYGNKGNYFNIFKKWLSNIKGE